MEKELLADILKYINVRAILDEVVFEKLIYAELDKLVLDSANTLDDSLAAMLKPILKAAVLDYVDAELKKLQPAW